MPILKDIFRDGLSQKVDLGQVEHVCGLHLTQCMQVWHDALVVIWIFLYVSHYVYSHSFYRVVW